MHLYFLENGYLEPLQYCAFYLYILQMGMGIRIYRGWLLGCFESCPFYTDDRFAGTMAESNSLIRRAQAALKACSTSLPSTNGCKCRRWLHTKSTAKEVTICSVRFYIFLLPVLHFWWCYVHRIACAMLFSLVINWILGLLAFSVHI